MNVNYFCCSNVKPIPYVLFSTIYNLIFSYLSFASVADIERVSLMAARHHLQNKDTTVCVIVLEEVGVTVGSIHNPTMVLHGLVDRGILVDEKNNTYVRLPIIGISNWAMDASKMNASSVCFFFLCLCVKSVLMCVVIELKSFVPIIFALLSFSHLSSVCFRCSAIFSVLLNHSAALPFDCSACESPSATVRM